MQSYQNPHPSQNMYPQQGPPPTNHQAPPPAPQQPTPEQVQQIQHLQRFERILLLPMFALYTDSESDARQREEAERAKFAADMAKVKAENNAATPQVSGMNKLVNSAVGAATGTSLFSMNNVFNGGVNALASFTTTMNNLNANAPVTDVVIIVRWASPPEQPPTTSAPVIIDVLEIRGIGQESNGAYITVKGNRDVKVKVGKYEEKIKKGGKWSKTVKGDCSVSVVEKGKGVFALEKVREVRMAMGSADWVDVMKRFGKGWVVPN